jgi:cytochrome c556
MSNCRAQTSRRKALSNVKAAIGVAALLAIALGVAAPALATSLKSLMSEMRDTTKQTKRLLAGSFDLAGAQAILGDYARQAGASEVLYAGRSDAKAGDPRARFVHMGKVAEAARGSVKDKASFRQALGAVAEDCRSCHADYK